MIAFDQAVQFDPSAIALALHTNKATLNGVLQLSGFGTLTPTSIFLAASGAELTISSVISPRVKRR
jgi:hypothetical protein